jgi:hypothetical protein
MRALSGQSADANGESKPEGDGDQWPSAFGHESTHGHDTTGRQYGDKSRAHGHHFILTHARVVVSRCSRLHSRYVMTVHTRRS